MAMNTPSLEGQPREAPLPECIPREKPQQQTQTLESASAANKLRIAFVGVCGALVLLTVAGLPVFGGPGIGGTPSPVQLPRVESTGLSAVILLAFALALLSSGRYRALGGAWVFWAGTLFLAHGVLDLFYLLSWPGLIDERPVITHLPNTSAWLGLLVMLCVALQVAAVGARGPQRLSPSFVLAGYASAAVLAALAGLLCVRFENALPSLIVGVFFTPLMPVVLMVLGTVAAAAAAFAYRRLRAEQDALLGYLAIFLITSAFGLLHAAFGGARYSPWWYMGRFEMFAAFMVMLVGFLWEGYGQLSRERVRAEERERLVRQLRNSEALYRTLVEAARDVIYTLAPDGTITSLNPAFERLTGWPVAQWVGRPQADLLHPDDVSLSQQKSFVVLSGETPPVVEMRIRTKSGEYLVGELLVAPLFQDGAVVGAVGIGRDITERKRMEESLRRSEETLRGILAAISDAVTVVGLDRKVLQTNDASLRMGGWSREEIIGANVYDFIAAEDRDRAMREAQEVLEKGVVRSEVKVLQKNGESYEGEIAVSLLRDASGLPTAFVGVTRDISQRKRMDEEREWFIQLISHDLRNPITALAGASKMLMVSLQQSGMEREAGLAGIVSRSAQAMNSMIQELLESASLSSPDLRLNLARTDLVAFIEELVGRLGTPEDRARLRVQRSDELLEVSCDATRLERVMVNLVSNALKYSDSEAPVVVRATKAGGEVVISVVDQGAGIAAEELPHVFERSYRASAGKASEGLGLGLYIARLIVEAHGGRIWAESEVDRGSNFSFALPLADSQSA